LSLINSAAFHCGANIFHASPGLSAHFTPAEKKIMETHAESG
jgi:hypothetical protein